MAANSQDQRYCAAIGQELVFSIYRQSEDLEISVFVGGADPECHRGTGDSAEEADRLRK